MAGEKRATADTLTHNVIENASQFSFFEAVRLLRRSGADAVRFRANPSLGFPATDILSIEPITKGDASTASPRYRMTVNFLGLYGAHSPLPTFYGEDVAGEDPDDSPRREFMDFFHHRLLSLFYDCWEKYRHYIQYERGAADDFSRRVFALAGLFDDTMRPAGHVAWPRLLSQVGLLAARSRSASVIESALGRYFSIDAVRVEQFVLRQVPIDDSQRNALGKRNCGLGLSLSLGERVADRAGKFRIVFGPLSLDQYSRFLPGGADHAALAELMAVIQREPLEYDVELKLKAEEAPALALTPETPCRLGWSTWLGGIPSAGPSVLIDCIRPAV